MIIEMIIVGALSIPPPAFESVRLRKRHHVTVFMRKPPTPPQQQETLRERIEIVETRIERSPDSDYATFEERWDRVILFPDPRDKL